MFELLKLQPQQLFVKSVFDCFTNIYIHSMCPAYDDYWHNRAPYKIDRTDWQSLLYTM